jgi:hypothetical protein
MIYEIRMLYNRRQVTATLESGRLVLVSGMFDESDPVRESSVFRNTLRENLS